MFQCTDLNFGPLNKIKYLFHIWSYEECLAGEVYFINIIEISLIALLHQ